MKALDPTCFAPKFPHPTNIEYYLFQRTLFSVPLLESIRIIRILEIRARTRRKHFYQNPSKFALMGPSRDQTNQGASLFLLSAGTDHRKIFIQMWDCFKYRFLCFGLSVKDFEVVELRFGLRIQICSLKPSNHGSENKKYIGKSVNIYASSREHQYETRGKNQSLVP